MLFNVKPARELTGGSFYFNGEFNEMLVEVGSILSHGHSSAYNICKMDTPKMLTLYHNVYYFYLLQHIQEQVGAYLAKYQGSSLSQITNFLKTSDKISGEVLEEDVLSIIQILILEERVYSAPTASGDSIYIWAGSANVNFASKAFGAPCFKCDVAMSCHLGKENELCPSKCTYLNQWLG
uniref:RNA polymerase rpc34 subunit containing protein n=1 Tax=Babesia bovis TaxID=5865 RepID=S6BMD1_BABBO|nr:RNA polymerase rpc34 subunit containing protein [Babesia bovis]